MDRIVAAQHAVACDDLMLCIDHGVAWQADMTRPVPYDAAYFDKYVGYEGKPIARAINAGRVALVNRWVGPERNVLDVGIGSGEFIRSRPKTFGTDVNPKAIAWLSERGLHRQALMFFGAFTFWDVLEHVAEPERYFGQMGRGAHLFTSLPVFDDLRDIRASRHYRPNEHFYYFTERGFVGWMAQHGFELLERSRFETEAGRDSIGSFAFRRSLG